MEALNEFCAAAGGLLLSIACGLMLEELIFGGLVRLFFASQRAAGSNGKERESKMGGRSC
ncbi:MAG TPA: hypothetical protein VN612_05940 [Acidobacteriaceae bacterium]|nr:hypothetical protein [Acidobacteriaceae bacterium]